MAPKIAGTADNIGSVIAAWRLMVERLPGHHISVGEGVAAIIANAPMAFLNFIVLDRPCRDADDFRHRLVVARGHAAACAFGCMVVLCPEWLPIGWEAIAADAGLSLATNLTGMAADTVLPPRRPLPAIDCRLVDDVAAATMLARINAHAYGIVEDQVNSICNLHLYRPGTFGVVGFVEGRPVSSTMAHNIGDIIYVAYVATEPDSYGRGYADAVMRRAIELAQAAGGTRRIWLHATDMGRPVYAAMGFETGAATPAYMFGDLPRS